MKDAVPNPHNVHAPILLVDDEPQLLRSTRLLLRAAGYREVLTCRNSREVLSLLEREPIAAVLLDLGMPDLSGRELLEHLAADRPELAVIVITATDDLDTAVACMQQGALDYLVKPVSRDRLLASLDRALEIRGLRREIATLHERFLADELRQPEVFAEIVTRSERMHTVFRYIEAVAESPQPVLITGETGTGKELIARAVHRASGRGGEFVAVNVAGLDDTVFADTLFGHVRGAYTGADRVRAGLIETAAEGTLFLDEIGDLDQTAQIKLLRLLQEGSYYPLGADQPRFSSARVVVATHRDPLEAVQSGRLRKDLYYRLCTHPIRLPALRERREDLPVLIEHFLARAEERLGRRAGTTADELLRALRDHDFPGNVRELEALVFDAVARQDQAVMPLSAPGEPVVAPFCSSVTGRGSWPAELPTLRQTEEALILEAMQRANGNQRRAAEMLGLTRQALNKRLVRARRRRT